MEIKFILFVTLHIISNALFENKVVKKIGYFYAKKMISKNKNKSLSKINCCEMGQKVLNRKGFYVRQVFDLDISNFKYV